MYIDEEKESNPLAYFLQRNAIVAAKELIKEAVFDKLDIEIFSPTNTFRVTDLGCSVGPNTFLAVQNILEAVEHKCRTQGHNSDQVPEFQVFFSDQAENDFNELFQSLPPDRNYYAMGVPGSFYSRLFPKACLHFVYSSFSLQCLSKVPEQVVDRSSPAWNKGRIHYSNSAHEVVEAYATQYAKDMECFLSARAQEIVGGGLVAFVVPGRPDGTPHAQNFYNMSLDLFGSCLMDMANKVIFFLFQYMGKVQNFLSRHSCTLRQNHQHLIINFLKLRLEMVLIEFSFS